MIASYLLVREFQHNKEISPLPTSRRGVPTSHKATEGQSDMTDKLNVQNYFAYGLFASTFLVFILAVVQLVEKSSFGGLWYFLGERNLTLSLPGIAKSSLNGNEFLRPYSTFSHPNSMGGFYLVLYFLINWFQNNFNVMLPARRSINEGGSLPKQDIEESPIRQAQGDKTIKILFYAIQILSLFLIVLSFSKVAIGTFVFLSFINLLRDKAYKGCIICFFARIFVLLIILFFGLLSVGDPYTIEKRLFLTRQAVEVFIKYPLIGSGLGTNIIAQSKTILSIPGKFTDTTQPVHNIYLMLLSETGLIGVGLMVYTIFNFRKYLSNWQKLPIMAISAILITGFFDHYWLTLSQNIALSSFVFALIFLKWRNQAIS
ncbi:MAG: O-antigen ligase family protein [Patescibacteria group bacterium]